jgi:tripartite-type tricarboxylate transporter receptor subunit TctC
MRRLISALALAACAFAAPASAQDKAPIRLVIGVPAGGSIDLIARLLADKLRDSLNDQVVVDIRAGAGGRLAVAETKKSAPDGRTIYVGASNTFTVLPNIYGDRLGYDPVKDFTPVGRLVRFDLGFATGPATPASAHNIKDALVWAKANPDKAAYGTPGPGTTSHFVGVMISTASGVPMTHVPYKGGTPGVNDLMGGHVAFMVNSFADMNEQHKAGRVRILASTGGKRSPLDPNVPTLKEAGINVEADVAIDAFAPAGVPPDQIKRLNAALVAAINSPDVRQRMQAYGLFPAPSSPDELRAFQATEVKMWAEPIKASGFKGD